MKAELKVIWRDLVRIFKVVLGVSTISVGAGFWLFMKPILATWLWNWNMPLLFGAPRVTFWQMICLLALVRLIFPRRSNSGD